MQPLRDYVFGIVAHFQVRARRTLERQHDDGFGIGVGLADHGRAFDVQRQRPDCRTDFVAHVVGGAFHVGPDVELDGNLAHALRTCGVNGLDPLDAVDLLFERLGNLRLDDVGIGPRVVGANGHHGRVDGRKLPHPQVLEAQKTEQNDEQIHHNSQHGALDGEGGDAHLFS